MRLQELLFAIGVQDNASGPIGRVQNSIRTMTDRVQGHFAGMATAALGAVGAVMSMKEIAGPAIELNRALADVSALGVDDAGLKTLQQAAGTFAMQYGGTAADVVRSSYDIQSAIDGLTGGELASFTTASGLLAKASKSKIENMTSYMGTMYGIFEKNAQRMGKSRWAEQMAAQTVYIANKYKSSGESMSAAFTSLGANAQSAGIEVAEQMSVLGLLQKTMPGPESGTKYKAFLAGVGQAQKTLGLDFTDSQGRMLSMVDILGKIEGKFGDLSKVKDSDLLKKAFGSEEAVSLIKLLLPQLGEMKDTIAEVRDISNLDEARGIARKTTDAFQRFGAAINYVQANAMQKLLPTLERWTNKATAHLETINKWIDKYPNVARVVGYAVLVIVGLAGVVAIATLAFHLWKLASLALGAPLRLVLGLVKLLGSGFLRLAAIMIANPIVLIILLIAAAIGLVIYYWDDLKAAFADSAWGAPFLWLMETIEQKWKMITDLFADFSWTKLLQTAVSLALTPLEAFINGLGKLLDLAGFDMGKDLLNWKATDLFQEEPETQPKPGIPEPARQAISAQERTVMPTKQPVLVSPYVSARDRVGMPAEAFNQLAVTRPPAAAVSPAATEPSLSVKARTGLPAEAFSRSAVMDPPPAATLLPAVAKPSATAALPAVAEPYLSAKNRTSLPAETFNQLAVTRPPAAAVSPAATEPSLSVKYQAGIPTDAVMRQVPTARSNVSAPAHPVLPTPAQDALNGAREKSGPVPVYLVAEPNARPQFSSLQAGKEPRFRPGAGLAGAVRSQGGSTGKTVSIGTQNLYFEHPPENEDDFAAMMFN